MELLAPLAGLQGQAQCFLEGKWRPGTRGGVTLILHLDLDSLHGGRLVLPHPHYLSFVIQSKESPFPFSGKEDHLLVKYITVMQKKNPPYFHAGLLFA